MNIMEMLTQQLGGDTLSKISQRVGADEGTTGKAVAAAIPLLLTALSRNTSQADGAQSLHKALQKDHSGGILDDIGGFLGNTGAANGAGILRHVLGDRRGTIESRLSQGTGLNAGAVGQILETVAPLVMGALGRATQQQKLDSNGLAGFLNGQQQMAGGANSGLMGMVTNLLDADNDGSVIDDLGRMAGKLFGRK